MKNRAERLQKFYKTYLDKIQSLGGKQEEKDALVLRLKSYLSRKAHSIEEMALIMDGLIVQGGAKQQEKEMTALRDSAHKFYSNLNRPKTCMRLSKANKSMSKLEKSP